MERGQAASLLALTIELKVVMLIENISSQLPEWGTRTRGLEQWFENSGERVFISLFPGFWKPEGNAVRVLCKVKAVLGNINQGISLSEVSQ
jgi:hypothetical protein